MSAGKKLMVVDDEDGIRSLVRLTLDSGGYEIIEACRGSDAVALAHQHHPDLLLLDVMLPDCSGLDVCRQLRNDPSMASTTIVMLTARAQTQDLGDAEEAGADGYLTKPFSPMALRADVAAMLGGGG